MTFVKVKLLSLSYHRYTRTRVGSCWPRRTQQDMRRHTAAAEQMSDSGPLHFLSIVSSTAEGAVLQEMTDTIRPDVAMVILTITKSLQLLNRGLNPI